MLRQATHADNPRISVLIPVYNSEVTIQRCIDSVLAQTYKSFQIILLNDGSTDESASICSQYSCEYSCIQYYTQENQGISAARQRLLEKADSDLILFLDADDSLIQTALEKLFLAHLNTDADLVQCAYVCVGNDYIQHADLGHVANEPIVYDGRYAAQAFQTGTTKLRSMLWGKMAKQCLFRDVVFPVAKIHEDEDTIHRVFYNAKKIAYIDEPLYLYYKTDNSIMEQPYNKARLDIIDALENRIAFYHEVRFMRAIEHTKLLLLWRCVNLYSQATEEYSCDRLYLRQKIDQYLLEALSFSWINDTIIDWISSIKIDLISTPHLHYWDTISKIVKDTDYA